MCSRERECSAEVSTERASCAHLVDAHAEGDGGDDDRQRAREEGEMHLLALVRHARATATRIKPTSAAPSARHPRRTAPGAAHTRGPPVATAGGLLGTHACLEGGMDVALLTGKRRRARRGVRGVWVR
eukprot:7388919-Prymnesium_polylepis.1